MWSFSLYLNKNHLFQSNNNNRLLSPESSIIQIKQPKSYGSLTHTEPFQKLTYSWSNIDVFGEAPQQNSVISNIKYKVKSCFGHEHKVPTPRKHLIKNVAGIAHCGEMLAVLGSRYVIFKIHNGEKSWLLHFSIFISILVALAKPPYWMRCHFDPHPVYKFPSQLFELLMEYQ